MTDDKPRILAPSEAAARLTLPVPGLVRLIRQYRYKFTELVPGGKPGDRGHHRWGLTEKQIDAIERGQERVLGDPRLIDDGKPKLSPISPDGTSRLRRGPRPRRVIA